MAHNHQYPATITPDEDGNFLVSFPDLPEALTWGNNLEDALFQAEDCLDEAIAYRITDKQEIPVPSPLAKGQYLISVPVRMALKAALYQALVSSGLSGLAAAKSAGLSDTQFRRLLAPRYKSDVDKLKAALDSFGVSISVRTVKNRRAA